MLCIPKEFTSTVPSSLLEQGEHNQSKYITEAHASMGIKAGRYRDRYTQSEENQTWVMGRTLNTECSQGQREYEPGTLPADWYVGQQAPGEPHLLF